MTLSDRTMSRVIWFGLGWNAALLFFGEIPRAFLRGLMQ